MRLTRPVVFFGRAVGINQVDVIGEGTAWIEGSAANGLGIIGLDWVRFNGTTNTDSYNAASGPYSGNNIHNGGSVASNGTITLLGTTDIHGDARPGSDTPPAFQSRSLLECFELRAALLVEANDLTVQDRIALCHPRADPV